MTTCTSPRQVLNGLDVRRLERCSIVSSGKGTKKLTHFEHGRKPHLIGDEILQAQARRSASQKKRRRSEAAASKQAAPTAAKAKKLKRKAPVKPAAKRAKPVKPAAKRAKQRIAPEPESSDSSDPESSDPDDATPPVVYARPANARLLKVVKVGLES